MAEGNYSAKALAAAVEGAVPYWPLIAKKAVETLAGIQEPFSEEEEGLLLGIFGKVHPLAFCNASNGEEFLSRSRERLESAEIGPLVKSGIFSEQGFGSGEAWPSTGWWELRGEFVKLLAKRGGGRTKELLFSILKETSDIDAFCGAVEGLREQNMLGVSRDENQAMKAEAYRILVNLREGEMVYNYIDGWWPCAGKPEDGRSGLREYPRSIAALRLASLIESLGGGYEFDHAFEQAIIGQLEGASLGEISFRNQFAALANNCGERTAALLAEKVAAFEKTMGARDLPKEALEGNARTLQAAENAINRIAARIAEKNRKASAVSEKIAGKIGLPPDKKARLKN